MTYLQVLNDEIRDHQQPILETVQDVESLLKQYSSKIDQASQSQLRNLQGEIRSRYGVINYQSQNRETKLETAVDELQKFSEDQGEFGTWIREAEKQQDRLNRSVGRDLETLKDQLKEQQAFNEDVMSHGADLRFMNVTGQKFLDAARVSR